MQQLLRNHRITAFVSLIALLMVLVALAMLGSQMRAKQSKVLEASSRLASIEQNKKALEEESSELGDLRAEIASLEQNVITEADVPTLLSSLEAIAKARAVDFDITGVNVEPQEGEAPARLAIDFSADGSLERIRGLLSDMLSQRFQARFTRFSLYAVSESGAPAPSLVSSGSASSAPTPVVSSKWNAVATVEIASFQP